MQLALIGGGQMGRALVGGMAKAGVIPLSAVTLADPSPDSQTWWTENHGDVTVKSDAADAAADADVILVAVKPNIVSAVAQQGGSVWSGKLVVSIAAGVSLEKLCDWFGHSRVVRVMPNTPSLVGHGASAFCCGTGITDKDRETVASMLTSVGIASEVTEKQIDAVTGLSGSGPAYICMVIEALADGGVLEGLPRPLALKLATQTVLGTATLVAETGKHPAELKDAVASPGGTTIAAIAKLEAAGMRNAMIQAVAASARQSRNLS